MQAVRWAVAVAALWCAGCGEEPGVSADTAGTPGKTPAVAAKKVDPAQAVKLTGVVRFSGTVPPPRKIKMATTECAALHPAEQVLAEVEVKDGKLANAFVHVKSGLEGYTFETPARDVVLDQVDCMFVPRIIGLMVNQKLTMKNSDPALHNVHTFPQENDTYNRGFPNKGTVQATSFPSPEVMIPIKCDVHGWMTGFVGVTAHPFNAVTGADGAFVFDGLPPGTYVVEAWHEKLKTATGTISLKAKESAQLDLVFGP